MAATETGTPFLRSLSVDKPPDAISCQFAPPFEGAILTLLKRCPGGSPQQLPPGEERQPAALHLSFVGPFFAEMNHEDAIIAFVFLLASVIWLIRLSDTDRRR